MSTRVIRRQKGYRRELSHEEFSPERRSWPQVLTLFVAMVAALALALYVFVPPPVVSADAPATEFSAERAMKDVRAIADEPHPMGSPEHEATADYIVEIGRAHV